MFNHKLLVFLLLILSIPLLFSCSNSTSPENVAPDEVIPLTMGNSWSYTYTNYDENGDETSSFPRESTIDKDTTISDLTCYAYSNHHSAWYTNLDDGYSSYSLNASSENEATMLMFKYPATKGDIYGDSEYRVEVISINEKITVTAGTFNVLHYSTTISDDSYMNDYEIVSLESFISPGIGLVNRMFIAKDSNGEEFIINSEELDSYSLK